MEIQINNYKCFLKSDYINLNKPINIFIGKNNAGKSSLLDTIIFILNSSSFFLNKNFSSDTKIIIRYYLKKELITNFEENERLKEKNRSISSQLMEFIKAAPDTYFNFSLTAQEQFKVDKIDIKLEKYGKNISNQLLAFLIKQIFTNVCRISSERRIQPEPQLSKEIVKNKNKRNDPNQKNVHILGSDGSNTTGIIEEILNNEDYDNNIVTKKLLGELNFIVSPEMLFKEISVQRIRSNTNNLWEIFLEENDGRKIALSNLGSGLQTILLTLTNTIIIPYIYKFWGLHQQFTFFFEELENNLHPSLQKKLFQYLYNFVKETHHPIFLSTHSNVGIDFLYDKPEINIYHIVKNELDSNIKHIDNILKLDSLIKDLGIHASDLLQANCIVWVEGPSDRIYFNKWIELFYQEKVIENVHYQCMFYGGRLLSHLSATPNAEDIDLIKLFSINRNSIIIIDSDIKKPKMKINQTKERIKQETEKSDGICWITYGREIENYISKKILEKIYNTQFKTEIDKYQSIEKYLEIQLGEDESTKFKKNKVNFARKICSNTSINDLYLFDLKEKIEICLKRIKEWNN